MLRSFLVLAALVLASAAQAQTPNAQCWQVEASGTPPRTNCGPSLFTAKTTSSATELVIKSAPGTLMEVTASNQNNTVGGFLMVFDATSAPADGAVTPQLCKRLPAAGDATITYNPGPGSLFSTGIVAVVSTGGNCYTKTSTVSAFISGMAQ